MELTFSHVDIVVSDVDKAVDYYRRVLKCIASEKQVWNRNGFHVESVVMFNGNERFFLVHPIAGNLKDLLARKGDGTIYRLCYTVPDMERAYDELMESGVQPEDENGRPVSRDNLAGPGGGKIIWLPKAVGELSIELLEAGRFEERMAELKRSAS